MLYYNQTDRGTQMLIHALNVCSVYISANLMNRASATFNFPQSWLNLSACPPCLLSAEIKLRTLRVELQVKSSLAKAPEAGECR